jgi:hypothetical protein
MRLLFREFVVAKQRAEDEHDARMTLAWTTAALTGRKKLPELKTLLAKREVRQNTRQLVASLQMISEVFKIPLGKKKKKK